MTKVIIERRDCKHCVEGEYLQEKIEIKERTIFPKRGSSLLETFEMVAGACCTTLFLN
ncbi:hypothetical protein KAT42_00780 [Candidatus Bathyarchaeota archaeon]|nr:hypothetical protein [Candidatus Bathyarchaeota archaeon]